MRQSQEILRAREESLKEMMEKDKLKYTLSQVSSLI